MSQRFCTGCQCLRDASTGQTKHFRTTARWLCQLCVDRKSESIYKNRSGKPANVAKIMDALYRKVA